MAHFEVRTIGWADAWGVFLDESRIYGPTDLYSALHALPGLRKMAELPASEAIQYGRRIGILQ